MKYHSRQLVSGSYILLASWFPVTGKHDFSSPTPTIQQKADTPGNSEKTQQFKLTLMANGATKNGSPGSQSTFESSTGEKVYLLVIHCKSSQDAGKEFTTVVDDATRIIEKKESENGSGSTEKRAVVEVRAKDGRTVTVILTWSDSVVREIQAFSPETALQFEKDAKANYAADKKPSETPARKH